MPVLNLSDSQSLALGNSAVKAAYLGSELKHFNPKAIGGLAAWYDASDTSSTVLVDSVVSQLLDKSGNDRNATQSTANNRPSITAVSSRQSIAFDGSNDSLACNVPCNSATTLFFVASASSQSNDYLLGGNEGGSSPGLLSGYSTPGGPADYEWWAGSGDDRLVIALASTGVNILSVTHTDGASVTCYLNGEQVATKATASATLSGTSFTRIGAGSASAAFSDCTFCEMLVYHSALSAPVRQRIESYLSLKWGIALA